MKLTLALVLLLHVGCSSSGKMLPRYEDDSGALTRLENQAEARCAERGFPAGKPTRSFLTDGCTAWPDKMIHQCCLEHDMDYWCGGSRDARRLADRRLRDCAEAIYGEQSGPFLGWMIEAGATAGGSPHLKTSWRWGYGHDFDESDYTEDVVLSEP
jgi:hypothetical protein